MITITPDAAQQIRESAKEGHMEGLPLRVAAKRNDDGSIHYAMGFADDEHQDDMHFETEGIEVVVSPLSMDLLNDTTIDYVQLDSGEKNFIFKNPNDPNFKPTDA
jgi:iron-sulfur cluster assembly protein